MAAILIRNVEKSWHVNLMLAPFVFYLATNPCMNMLVCTHDQSELFLLRAAALGGSRHIAEKRKLLQVNFLAFSRSLLLATCR